MSNAHATLALILDFDDTLLPDSTTKLLEEHGIDPNKFWKEDVRALVEDGFDPSNAYLKLILDNVGEGKPLGKLTNQDLRQFGKRKMNRLFYPGVKRLFPELKKIVKKRKEMDIEFYVISGGLQEIIEGCDEIRHHLSGVYGCQLAGDSELGELKYVKRSVTFTEKTRFLFEINKGLPPSATQKNPYLVNKNIEPAARRIPFSNMIYAGDGLTDIPCFSLLKKQGGSSFGVFKADEESAKRALLEFLKTDRVIASYTPKYRKSDDLGIILRAAVQTRCAEIELARKQAEAPN